MKRLSVFFAVLLLFSFAFAFVGAEDIDARYVSNLIGEKRETLNNTGTLIDALPSWYGDELREIVDLVIYYDKLDAANKSVYNVSSANYVRVAGELDALLLPSDIILGSEWISFVVDEGDVEPDIIAEVGVDDVDDSDVYVDSILEWSENNVYVTILSRGVSVVDEGGGKERVFTIYKIDVESLSDLESYFVVNLPFEDLTFAKDFGAVAVDDSTVFSLGAKEFKSFEFFVGDDEGISFFASPKLSSIIIDDVLDLDCNYNFVCESGEDYKTCRGDCSPTGWIVFYVVLAVVVGLILYALLTIWYRRRYENFLFGDRQELYNILMYATNARARGISDGQIKKDLKKQGWSGEKIIYVIRKSRGERVGMFEIIPVGKIVAWWRVRRAKKNIVTASRQQNERNINKSGYRPIRI